MPLVVPIPAPLFIVFMLVAAVLLAAWTLVRFQRLGPRSLTGGFVAMLAAFALIAAVPAIIDAIVAAGIPGARELVVFGLGLPVFTYFFLAGGWFMRTLLRLPGHFG
jgi:glucan phosphoethanolaminetransferase (alkaline phosphatase superfamily)